MAYAIIATSTHSTLHYGAQEAATYPAHWSPETVEGVRTGRISVRQAKRVSA